MQRLFLLPLNILKFWYSEAPLNILRFLASLNKAFLGAFSLSLMLKTFFKPWKNEYRDGLVGFSIIMGIAIKTIFIFVDLILFAGLLGAELVFYILFFILPILAFCLPFIKI